MSHMTDLYRGLPDPELSPDVYADIPVKRAIAWIVDALVVFLLTLAILPFTFFLGLLFYAVLWLMVSFIYRVTTLATGSATLGMRLMSVEMRTFRGERFGLSDAIMHVALFLVFFSFVVPQIISAVLMLTTARAQGLHDLILGTVAVNRSH